MCAGVKEGGALTFHSSHYYLCHFSAATWRSAVWQYAPFSTFVRFITSTQSLFSFHLPVTSSIICPEKRRELQVPTSRVHTVKSAESGPAAQMFIESVGFIFRLQQGQRSAATHLPGRLENQSQVMTDNELFNGNTFNLFHPQIFPFLSFLLFKSETAAFKICNIQF